MSGPATITKSVKRKLQQDNSLAFSTVKFVIPQWGPDKLLGMGVPDEEFDTKIIAVIRQLDRRYSAGNAAQVISRLFTSSFIGEQAFNAARCRAVGELLVASLNTQKSSTAKIKEKE